MTMDIKGKDTFGKIYLLKEISERRTKQGKPYLALILGTPGGEIEGRIWDMELKSLPALVPGDPIQAEGKESVYQDRKQLIIDRIEKAGGDVDPRLLYPSSSIPEARLREDFSSRVSALKEPALKALFMEMERDENHMGSFFTAPAAITMHHARIGGLAEHSLGVCRTALAIAEAHPWLRTDLLITGSLLHDIGKVLEYQVAGDFRYSTEGKLIGHITLGTGMVREWVGRVPGFPENLALEVLHIVLSHHGQLEHGSPRTPATPEALVIHYADDLDAKLDMLQSASADPETVEAFVRGLRRTFIFSGNGTEGEAITDDSAADTPPAREDDDQGKLF
jgi:3'-5' exoribonuclease